MVKLTKETQLKTWCFSWTIHLAFHLACGGTHLEAADLSSPYGTLEWSQLQRTEEKRQKTQADSLALTTVKPLTLIFYFDEIFVGVYLRFLPHLEEKDFSQRQSILGRSQGQNFQSGFSRGCNKDKCCL